MTVSVTTSYTRAAGNGVTTVFNFAFKIFSATDLVVRDILDSTGAPTTKTNITDYTVAISATGEGGTVSMVAAPASGHTLDIRSSVPVTQEEDIRNQGRFLPEIHEGVFDKLVRQIQDTRRLLALAPRLPDSELPTIDWETLLSLTNRKGKFFGFFNATTGAPELYASIGATVLTQAVIGSFLWPQTTSEGAASVTPTSTTYPPYIDSRRYGATGDGATNDAVAIQNQINAASSGMGLYRARRVELTAPEVGAVAFKCTSGITVNPLKALVEGNGNTLDFSSILSAFVGLTLDTFGTNQDTAAQVVQVGAREQRNLVILMPSYTLNGSGTGLLISDSIGDGIGSFFGARTRLSGISIFGGNIGLLLNNGAFSQSFDGLSIMHGPSHFLNIAISASAGWITRDGGEQLNFTDCFLGASQYQIQIPGGTIRYKGGSIDGGKTIVQQNNIGTVALDGVYMEHTNGDDTQYLFDATDTNARIELADCEFSPRPDLGTRVTTAFAHNLGFLSIRNIHFIGTGSPWYKANDGYLVTGAGTTDASGIRWRAFPFYPIVARTQQWLAYPDANNANLLPVSATQGFTLGHVGAGVNPVRALAISDGSVSRDAFDFQIGAGGVSNDESSAIFNFPCGPGVDLTTVFTALSPSMTGSNLAFDTIVKAVDAAGNTISGPFTTTHFTTTQSSWTSGAGVYGFSAATPNGTTSIQVYARLRATGAVAAARHVYLSPWGVGPANGLS